MTTPVYRIWIQTEIDYSDAPDKAMADRDIEPGVWDGEYLKEDEHGLTFSSKEEHAEFLEAFYSWLASKFPHVKAL